MSQKANELVMKVRDILQDGSKDPSQCLREIDDEIDHQNHQIRELFSEHLDSVVEHYVLYQQTMSTQKRLQQECEDFRKHIDKTTRLNQYDQSIIQRTQKTLEQMNKIKQNMQKYLQHIRLAKKAVINIREDKYNNAIKVINQYKTNEPTPVLETPLKKVLPQLKRKIEEHLSKLLDAFWTDNGATMLNLGKQCFTKIQANYQQKMNIYHTFFGRNSTKANNFGTGIRATTVDKDDDLKFLRRESQENAVNLNKFILRINVEMANLKKAKLMATQVESAAKFTEMMKNNIKRQLTLLEENNPCENSADFRNLLWVLIGFLLIRREVIAFFNLRMEQKVFTTQIFAILSKASKGILDIVKQPKMSLELKQISDIFYKILELIKICNHQEKYNQLLTIFVGEYCVHSVEVCDIQCSNEVIKDTLARVSLKDDDQKELIKDVLGIPFRDEYTFTSVVRFMLKYFNETFSDLVMLVRETDLEKNITHSHLADLFERVISLYGSELLAKSQIFEIIQGQVNIQFIEGMFKYYTNELQNSHGFARINEFTYTEKLQALTVKLTRTITEIIKQKMEEFMENYHSVPVQRPIDSHNQFVDWMMEYIKQVVVYMREVECPTHEGIIIETMRELCEQYWGFLGELQELSLITLFNLDIDLTFIYKYCDQNFSEYSNILEKLRSLKEFYSLFLLNNINDITDPQKKSLSYPNLDLAMILPLLKKYAQPKGNFDRVRQLKKKDVEVVVKKIQAQLK